jgi:hypothetical protein
MALHRFYNRNVLDAPQSSPALGRLPASLVVAFVLAATPVFAQTQRVPAELRFAKTPGGSALGTLLPGAQVATGRVDGESIEVTIDGWVISTSLDPSKRDGFDLILTQKSGENLRQAPNGAVVAKLSSGVLLNKVSSQGGWTRVKRSGWVSRKSLASNTTAPASDAPSGPSPADRVEVTRNTPLAAVAGGAELGSLDSGMQAKILGRAGEWTRVQFEAWVKDSALRPATDDVLIGVSQAEVRANPSRFVGKVVEWRVQFVAIQKADELRPEIPAGQSYLLTRGPLPEPGFVYVIVPQNKLDQFRAVESLQELTIRATIKSATSKYLPTPVVELVGVVKGLGS